ncbi:hypothetical protein WICPIJ_003215 [Wickerhamomyces pijperi]|uniref:Major facilitator superfamily (MFS) profile domain-containing protein n=1 Tax=Wickerhamomyces pijperi TaxID=599730 RepID=A0A9P8TNX3_WICPI|nr:hypothetical protein WICPIJ_003215 [Wickerhamomyces pijperi]
MPLLKPFKTKKEEEEEEDKELETSRTIVETNVSSYFDIPSSIQEINESNTQELTYASYQQYYEANKDVIFEQKKKDINHPLADLERQISQESTNSNCSTIGNNYETTKDAMFAEDAGMKFPEGGFEAWRVVLGSFMALTSIFGLENVSGVIETHILENQLSQYKQSTIGWIFSINLFVMFVTSVFSGTYFDRNGCTVLIILGGILVTGGLVATGNASEMWHFVLSYGLCCGLGSGLAVSAVIGPVNQYFNRKRGLVSSISSSGGSVGGIVFPFMLRKLYVQVGFTRAMRCFALVHGFCFLSAALLIKERIDKPDISQQSVHSRVKTYLTAFDLSGLQDLRFFLCCLGCVFAESLALTMGTYYVSYAKSHGLSLSSSYLLISLTNAGGIPGRWITGLVSDHVGRFNVMAVTLFLCGVSCLVILIPFAKSHNSVFYVFAVVWGFTTGSIFSLIPVCCAQISKTQEFGKRYGTMYSMVGCGVLIWIPISGSIIADGTDLDYRNFILFMGVTGFCASGCYAWSRAKCIGWKNIWAKF